MTWWRRLFSGWRFEAGLSRGPLHEAALGNWNTLRTNVSQRKANGHSYNPAEREAFELLRAAILYEVDGLASFPDRSLHDKWRDPLQSVPADFLMEFEQPYFSLLGSPSSAAVAQMHLASAALRLPVAMEATIKACPSAALPFSGSFGLWDGKRWDRGRATAFFPAVRALGHCSDRPLGNDRYETLRRGVVIALVLRDDFGHGEIGDPAQFTSPAMKVYVADRKAVLDELHACRIVTAETELIAWAVECLG